MSNLVIGGKAIKGVQVNSSNTESNLPDYSDNYDEVSEVEMVGGSEKYDYLVEMENPKVKVDTFKPKSHCW